MAIVRPRSRKSIHRLDGRPLDTPSHVLIPQTASEAVWIERSEVLGLPAMGSENIVLRREVVRRHHVWRGRFHPSGRVFFSGALTHAVEASGLRKLRFTCLKEA